MEIHDKLHKTITNIKLLKSQPDLPSELVEFTLSNIPYSDELKNTLYTNPDLALKILSRYKKITTKFISEEIPLEKLIQFVENSKFDFTKMSNDRVGRINKLNVFNNQIKSFLVKENYFQKSYDELGIDNKEITQQDVIDYKKQNPNNIVKEDVKTKFEYRKNQLETITHLKTFGLETGIHCESTGCGKSVEILLYIAHCYKLNPKCKIILFTERVNILADLFDFSNTSNPIDSQNVKRWKEYGICDLTGFDIVDRVTVKKSDWVKIINRAIKPTLLVINRAYLTLTDGYKNINGLDLILHDECHNVASNKCYEFLKYIKSKSNIDKNDEDDNKSTKSTKSTKLTKSKSIPIVGFSATPLRAGKTKSGDEMVLNKDRLVEIYGKSDGGGQLNLITNYNMIYAISENLILPPQFHWFNIDSYQTKKKSDIKNKHEFTGPVSKSELGSVMKILDELVPKMPNRKIVAWCGTIPLCDEWYKLFDEYKEMYENLKDIKIYKDYSKRIDDTNTLGYSEFKHIKSDGIMFCAQKHREGSDIYKLDSCIFLDKVKMRGPIPFIQSIGRVLRKDYSEGGESKTVGFVIDGVVRDEEGYEKNIVDKILGYYFALADLASIDDIMGKEETAYSKYVKLMDLIEFEPDEKKIKLRLDKTKIEINCKKLDWANIVKNFEPMMEKKVGLGEDEKLRAEFERLKKIALKLGKKINNKNLVSSWKKLAKKKELEPKPEIKYKSMWKGWYDFYQIDIGKYPKTKNEWIKKCKKYELYDDNYFNKAIEFENIPELPQEIYQNFTNVKIELENLKNKLIA
jgi:hypothetical protein